MTGVQTCALPIYCNGHSGATYTTEISAAGFSPNYVDAKRCDQLVVYNSGSSTHLLALGEHQNHVKYPGYKETVLKPGEHVELVLGADGSYLLHDHLDERLQGRLNVTQ